MTLFHLKTCAPFFATGRLRDLLRIQPPEGNWLDTPRGLMYALPRPVCSIVTRNSCIVSWRRWRRSNYIFFTIHLIQTAARLAVRRNSVLGCPLPPDNVHDWETDFETVQKSRAQLLI
jgi:hypothetical protein